MASVDAYVAEVMAADLPPTHSPTWTLQFLHFTDDAASAKVEDQFGSRRFTNYRSLLRVEGEWKIVCKLYHLHA